MDKCKYVNVFQGCGQVDLPEPRGIAAKWFFIKAMCGNTTPAACVPFGKMSVAPFSGGYPTGYGDHLPNSHSLPGKFEDGDKLLGFAHLQQSGTGAIGYYYNYALTVPGYGDSPARRLPEDERAEPGYYTCRLEDIQCELTSSKTAALHRYTFGRDGGRVTVDFTNNGLKYSDEVCKPVNGLIVSNNGGTVTARAKIEGIDIFFAVRGNGKIIIENGKAVFYDFGRVCCLTVGISLCDTSAAISQLKGDFDEVRKASREKWNEYLGRIEIETDDETVKEIFYSNLYHSFVKPADWAGESFVYEKGLPFFTDFATLWDVYKTQLPLVFMLFREEGESICETLLLLGEKLGYIPNALGLCEINPVHESQARALGCYTLLTAYRYGLDIDPKRLVKVIDRDIFSPAKEDFTLFGKCASYTFMLDMADCCALAADLAREVGEGEIYERLYPLSLLWKKCYSEETGLLKEDSSYYEGTLYNYSFRQMVSMRERIELAGGDKEFVKLLDKFFGYGCDDIVQPVTPYCYAPVEEGMKLGRFEGFNNESDTEAPFSYIYAGRHDRTCEIIRAGMKYMFTTGRGGIPGNNDSGALSSYYVLAGLGIYPEAGQDLFLIGSPFLKSAKVRLYNSSVLEMYAHNNSDENIYVKEVRFNGRRIENFMIKASELLKGGKLEFEMTDRPDDN